MRVLIKVPKSEQRLKKGLMNVDLNKGSVFSGDELKLVETNGLVVLSVLELSESNKFKATLTFDSFDTEKSESYVIEFKEIFDSVFTAKEAVLKLYIKLGKEEVFPYSCDVDENKFNYGYK